MKIALWIACPILFITAAILTGAYICFFKIFRADKKKEPSEEYPIPDGSIYEEYREDMIKWIDEARAKPQRDVEIISFDGLRLRGKYFEHAKGAPIELLMHGYRGTAERDLSGGVARCHALGRNALIVDHRASGRSEGKVITFGVNESRDCLSWVNFIINEIDPDAKIIITGISMGAGTVMIAASEDLPKNVIGALADCGYTSAREIISKVMEEMKLPSKLLYPLARLGGILFGRFDPDSRSPIESMKKSKIPVIFIHGDVDDFVPYYMSERNYEACVTKKKLVCIKGAGHGLCFPVDKEGYLNVLREFFGC